MLSDLTDKEQIELFKKWWRDYGKSITFALVLGLCIGFGWRYWNQHQMQHSQQASLIYAQLQNIPVDKQADAIRQLLQKYPTTPYASLAALSSARYAVMQKNYPQALQQLQWVMSHARLPSFKQIARLRAARVLLAQQQLPAALELLTQVDDPTYLPLIDEVKGDVYIAMGDLPAAKKFYQNAQNGLKATGIANPLLQMKYTNID